MTTPINEMNLPMVSIAPTIAGMAVDTSMATSPAPAMEPAEITVCSPDYSKRAEDITVYSQSITPTAYNQEDAMASFDIVFSVGVRCGDGSSKTYQVVKRISLDKCKLAAEAETSTPVSVVEAVNKAAVNRFRILAGLA
jgi:hypothetical protein